MNWRSFPNRKTERCSRRSDDGASRASGCPPPLSPNPKGRTGQKPGPTLKLKGNLMRKRNKTITIRVTEGEWCAIMEQVLKAGMNVTDYLVTAATTTQIYVAEDTKPLITELKRIGNNLNQITAKINAGAFHSYNFYEVIEMQRAIYEEVRRIGRGD